VQGDFLKRTYVIKTKNKYKGKNKIKNNGVNINNSSLLNTGSQIINLLLCL